MMHLTKTLNSFLVSCLPPSRVITRGDILHIAPNSPHLLKPWRFVAIFMLEYGMWRTLRLWPSSHTWNYSKSSNGSGENEVLRWLTSF